LIPRKSTLANLIPTVKERSFFCSSPSITDIELVPDISIFFTVKSEDQPKIYARQATKKIAPEI
jgi:hypothetical protein